MAPSWSELFLQDISFLLKRVLKEDHSLALEFNVYPHLLDPQSVFSWSKTLMTLPQRSGLESLGHKVTDGKTILFKGKVSTTDFIGFSYQPASLNLIYSRC